MGNYCTCNKQKQNKDSTIKIVKNIPSKFTESFLREQELDIVQ